MEFFGLTQYGPQSYIKDVLKEGYKEPSNKEEAKAIIKTIQLAPSPTETLRSDRQIDCYITEVNGFAYGSIERFIKMKRKGVIKPIGPNDMYRIPATTSMEYGWWQYDPHLINKDWYATSPRYPQPSSPNTRILDIVRKNNKYATLF